MGAGGAYGGSCRVRVAAAARSLAIAYPAAAPSSWIPAAGRVGRSLGLSMKRAIRAVKKWLPAMGVTLSEWAERPSLREAPVRRPIDLDASRPHRGPAACWSHPTYFGWSTTRPPLCARLAWPFSTLSAGDSQGECWPRCLAGARRGPDRAAVVAGRGAQGVGSGLWCRWSPASRWSVCWHGLCEPGRVVGRTEPSSGAGRAGPVVIDRAGALPPPAEQPTTGSGVLRACERYRRCPAGPCGALLRGPHPGAPSSTEPATSSCSDTLPRRPAAGPREVSDPPGTAGGAPKRRVDRHGRSLAHEYRP